MIIIKIQGGLGNQLLQYSIGQVIARNLKKDVAYDLSFFDEENKYTKRPYLLDKFVVDVRVATREEIKKAKLPYGIISKYYSLCMRVLNKYLFKKYYIGYDKDFMAHVAKSKSLYLEGFWQGYKYYEKNLEELNTLITLKDMSSIEKFKQEFNFSTKNSVSVHIRRGDFTKKNAGTKVVPKEYYEKAVPFLEKKVANPTYYIFSDDIEWVKQEMGGLFKDVVYVSSSSLKDYEEFMLMKECNHAILSNSTFCWFSTLLTNTKEKVVVYPNNWENVYLNKDKHICPPEWQGL